MGLFILTAHGRRGLATNWQPPPMLCPLVSSQWYYDPPGCVLREAWHGGTLGRRSICSYTSELFYEGKLVPHPSLAAQVLSGPTPFAGTGLFYVPVEHEGNQNSSPEEAERATEIVTSLVAPGVTWTSHDGQTRSMLLSDILIVAPYNAQLSEIGRRIPGGRIGTVDKFQGQEAPVVIYSIATSSPDEAPHGMEFLFSRHRLNERRRVHDAYAFLLVPPRYSNRIVELHSRCGWQMHFVRT
jgi:hypothetical protein